MLGSVILTLHNMNNDTLIGMTIADNDPRMTGRKLVVKEVDCRYAYAARPIRHTGALVRIQLNRIFTDSKPRRTGFSVVPNAPGEPRDQNAPKP